MKPTVISIVTPTFQHEKFIAFTIESVIYQAGEFYIDYIIIDGGSKDRNVEQIKAYEKLLNDSCDKKSVDGLEYFVNKPGQDILKCLGVSYRWVSEPDEGQADAINKGIDRAVGDIFSYINSDDIYEQHAFQTIVEFFAKDEITDVVYGNALYIDGSGKVTGMYLPQDINKQSINVNCVISQPSAFVRMSTVRKFGGFNKKFRNSMDYEYWLRLWHGKAKFKFIHPVLSCTRLHDSTKTKLNRVRINMESLAAIKHYNKRIPLRAKATFMLESSASGKLTYYFLTFARLWQKVWGYIYSPIFFLFHKGKVAETEKQLFSSI